MPPWEKYRSPSTGAEPVFTPLPKNPYDVAKDSREEARNQRGEGRDDARTGIAVEGNERDAQGQTFSQAKALRDEFNKNPAVETYRTIMRQYGTGLKAEQSPAGDQALINAYSQMLNPTSTVMLGEYQATEQVDSTLNKVRERLKKEFGWDGAGRISEGARLQLLREMQNITENSNKAYNQERQNYSGLAQRYGYQPDEVVGTHLGQAFYDDVKNYWEKAGVKVLPEGKDTQGNPLPAGARPIEASPAGPPPGDGYQDSYLGQVMSGANEGLASTLGAPFDLATMGLNLIPKGMNALTNSNIPEITRPFLGSEMISDAMDGWGVYGKSQDQNKQSARRVGQSVGAAAVPIAAAPGSFARAAQAMGLAAGGGVGAATAQRAFPNNPAAEFAGEVLGSGLSAATLARANRLGATRRALEAVPSRETLRDQASNLYGQAESRGIVAGPNVTSNLAGRFSQIADDEKLRWPNGKVDPNYPRAGAALDMMDAHKAQNIDPRQIQVLRDNLTDSVGATQGKERRVAKQFLEAFDAETIPLAPELAEARQVAGRYLQSDEIMRARALAEADAPKYSNGGMENALRTRFRALDRDIIKDRTNFNPAAGEAVSAVSRGDRYTNALRAIGKLAPTGAVSTGLSAGVPFAIGNAFGGPAVGAAASATSLGLGSLARSAATKATERQALMVDALARNGGELNVAPLLDPETEKLLAGILGAQAWQHTER